MNITRRIRDRYEIGGATGVVESGYNTVISTLLQFWYDRFYRERTDAKPYKILRVDPQDIEYFSGTGIRRSRTGEERHLEYLQRPWYHRCAEYGDVLGGDWDTRDVKFTAVTEWQLIEERFGEGIPWEETSVYEDFVACLERGESVYGCSTVDELHERFRYLRRIKESMESEGYRRNTSETPDGIGVGRAGEVAGDEVTVDIGRDGELLHNMNGRHRLALAKVLGVPEIPVLVKVRHAEWQRTRDRIRTGADVPETNSHPDLADLTGTGTE